MKNYDVKMQGFCIDEMHKAYHSWKGRLSRCYKSYSTYQDRIAHPPENMSRDLWKEMVAHFSSAEFKVKSEKNSKNRAAPRTVHTTGPIPFVEFEHNLCAKNSGIMPDPSQIWMKEHTKKTDNEELQWADPKSADVYDQLQNLENQPVEEGVTPMTRDDMLIEVLGARSGHFRGKGSGWKGKGVSSTNAHNRQQIYELQQTVIDLQATIETDRANREVEKEYEKKVLEELMTQQFEEMFNARMNQMLSNFGSPPSTTRNIGT